MKKIVYLFLLLIGFSSCKKESFDDLSKINKSNESLLVGKWIISYDDNGFRPVIGDVILFNSDGTGSLISGVSKTQGTWSLSSSVFSSSFITNDITRKSNGNTIYNVINLSEKELILHTSNLDGTFKIKMIK